MRLFDFFRATPDDTKQSAVAPLVAFHRAGMPVWNSRDYQVFASTAYQKNPIGFRCVKMIASAAASVDLLLHSGTGKRAKAIEEHPLLELLARPSRYQSGRVLFEQIYTYLLLSGNSYIESVRVGSKPAAELYALRPDRMRVIPGSYGGPVGYEYKVHGKKKVWGVAPITGRSDILHIKEFNPLDDWYGMSRADPAHMAIERHNAASEHTKSLLDNGARPSGALIFKPQIVNGKVVMPPKEAIDAAYDDLKHNHSGSGKAGEPMVLGGDIDWKEMSTNARDMDFQNGKDDAGREICLAWGVPHILIVQGAATYNNIKEAKLQLYEETVLPLLDFVLEEFNSSVVKDFGDGLVLSGDLDSVPALEPRRESRRTTVTELLKSGVIDDTEAREALQYGPRAKDSVKKIDAPVLTALINVAKISGITPLARYMRSVGLIPQDMTDDQILAAAMQLIEDDNLEDEQETGDPKAGPDGGQDTADPNDGEPDVSQE